MLKIGDKVLVNDNYPGWDKMQGWEREIRTVSHIVNRELFPIVLENGDIYFESELDKV
jgi:hypothetical protein